MSKKKPNPHKIINKQIDAERKRASANKSPANPVKKGATRRR